MSSTKNIASALTEVAENIQDHLDKNNTNISIYSGPTKMPIVNNFALLFHSSFLETIDEYKLSLNDIRVVLKIIDYMKFGNLIHISWSKIALDLNIKPNNITRHISKLKKAKLIIDDSGNIYLNPQIIAKGKFLQQDKELKEILNKGAEILEGTTISPNIITKEIREKTN